MFDTGTQGDAPAVRDAGWMRNKVPAVTALFWVTKLLTTAMGETTSDFLVKTIDPFVAVGGAFAVFAVAMVLQFAVKRYIPWVYWFAVLSARDRAALEPVGVASRSLDDAADASRM
jgi:uncharacterized membrane-anchored protein